MSLQIFATLGSPLAECAHFGVCTIIAVAPETWETFIPVTLRKVKAWLDTTESGQLLFHFPQEGMTPATRRQFFPAGGFRVDAPLTLPADCCLALGLPEQTQMLPGNYPITVTAAGFAVAAATATNMQQRGMAA